MRTISYPLNDVHKIHLPDEWLCDHLLRYQAAQKKIQVLAKGAIPEDAIPLEGMPQLLTDLALALCLLDDYELPGLPAANPAMWRIDKCPLRVAVWVKATVLDDFATSLTIPKN